MQFDVEYTDTFGGDANYSWVKRETLELSENISDAMIMRAAKRVMGLSGLRGRTHNYGDTIEFRPYGICAVMFINARY